MSRYIKFVILTLLISISAAAQTHYKPHISVGGRAGVALSRLDLSPRVPQSFLIASQGAITFRYQEEKLFGLIAELGWATRGWKEDFEEAPLSYSRSLTYLTLPVLTHISFGPRRVKFCVNLGPEIAYNIAETRSANFDIHNLASVTQWPQRKRQTEQLAKDIQNKFDYGITAGAGVEFYITPRNSIYLDARYYYGLGNIFHSTKSDTFSASRCTSIEISLGYNFRLR